MTIDPEYDDDELDDDEEQPTDSSLVKQLRGTTRQQKKQIRDLMRKLEENSAASRKLAIIEAELPRTKAMDFFLEHYNGDFTADAIRQAAAESGFLEVSNEVDTDLDTVEEISLPGRGGWPAEAPGTDADLKAKIQSVTGTGPAAIRKVAELMKNAGRLQEDE
jgi:hypothetical protein